MRQRFVHSNYDAVQRIRSERHSKAILIETLRRGSRIRAPMSDSVSRRERPLLETAGCLQSAVGKTGIRIGQRRTLLF